MQYISCRRGTKKWQHEYHQLKYIYSKDLLVLFFGICYCHIDGCTLRYLSTSLDVYGDCVELRKHPAEDFPVQLEDATWQFPFLALFGPQKATQFSPIMTYYAIKNCRSKPALHTVIFLMLWGHAGPFWTQGFPLRESSPSLLSEILKFDRWFTTPGASWMVRKMTPLNWISATLKRFVKAFGPLKIAPNNS